MKRKRTPRASQPKTIRLDADASRIVEYITVRTAWASNLAVNRLIHAGWHAMQGKVVEGQLLAERTKAAANLLKLRESNAREEAELRRKERSIADKIKPVHLAELAEPKAAAAAAK